jgi:hypothetical protein
MPASKQRSRKEEQGAGPALRRLLREQEAAAFLGTTAGSLRQDRCAGNLGVPWVRFGRRGVRYDLSELEAYVASRTIRPEAAA